MRFSKGLYGLRESEFRAHPEKLGFDSHPDAVFSDNLLDCFGTFSLADLSGLEEQTLLGHLIRTAWMSGLVARAPSENRTVRTGTITNSKELSKRRLVPWLWQFSRDARMRQKTIDKIAPILHQAVLDELIRRSGAFDIRAAVAAEVPKLQAQLNASLGPAYPSCEPVRSVTVGFVAA